MNGVPFPDTPGRPLPAFYRSMDSSEEVRYYLASEQGRQRMSWADRVNKLRHVLSTGIDVSNELFYNMYSKGRVNLPSDRQYYVDSSGEIYYDSDHQNQVVQAVVAVFTDLTLNIGACGGRGDYTGGGRSCGGLCGGGGKGGIRGGARALLQGGEGAQSVHNFKEKLEIWRQDTMSPTQTYPQFVKVQRIAANLVLASSSSNSRTCCWSRVTAGDSSRPISTVGPQTGESKALHFSHEATLACNTTQLFYQQFKKYSLNFCSSRVYNALHK
ncbi:hypothetical protein E2C01_002455 [Portunus trituberculatus]|uniref:Uncharacterized protein n=1 Tax=Portunus trituberculatus TaxID=210409 RepID=A0A5B7CJQ8_PORTR|nr:hypothetical protein [Portunus trituberculatus]